MTKQLINVHVLLCILLFCLISLNMILNVHNNEGNNNIQQIDLHNNENYLEDQLQSNIGKSNKLHKCNNSQPMKVTELHSSYGEETEAPSPPRWLQASSRSNYINLSWACPLFDGGSKVTNYKIYRSMTSGKEYTLLTNYPATSFENNLTYYYYSDNLVENNQTYYYIVRAVNSVGISSASNEAFVTFTLTSKPTDIIKPKSITPGFELYLLVTTLSLILAIIRYRGRR